jgi:protein phosphatase
VVTLAGPMRWSSSARSHRGHVRNINEDAWLERSGRGLWAVADGMGGHALGEFASRLAVHSLTDLPAADDLESLLAMARQRLRDANRQLRVEALRRDVTLIGTTIAALLVSGRKAACLWAGDSRIYRQRGGRLQQLTCDHSQLQAACASHPAGADVTLDRPPPNVITRALGVGNEIELDSVVVDVLDGDVFLLCSDGLSNEVEAASIAQALLPGRCQLAADALLDLALARGGRDNITAVVVRADDPDSPDRTQGHPVLQGVK